MILTLKRHLQLRLPLSTAGDCHKQNKGPPLVPHVAEAVACISEKGSLSLAGLNCLSM